MESIGEFFRQVRETKGLSLDDVASKTRIHPDFLRALEDGNYAKLPDQVFAKGFVRSYARSLGLDEDDAMRRFDQSAGAFYDKQSETERLRIKQAEDEKRRKANRKVVIAAVAVAVLGLVLLLTREQSSLTVHRRSSEPPRAVAPAGPSAAARPAADATDKNPEAPPGPSASAQGSSERAAEEAGSEPAGPAAAEQTGDQAPVRQTDRTDVATSLPPPIALPDVTAEPLPGGENAQLVLDMEALELSWVVVQVDGASPHEALLRPGERARWKAQEQFTITLGNAGGVRVELDGKPQGPFGPNGKVARDIVLKR